MPPDGFVVAMRGRLVLQAVPRLRRRGALVSLIVSRFGAGNLLLAISLTGLCVTPGADPCATPRVTALGCRLAGRGERFRLLGALPPRLRLAGRWRASAGLARLRGAAPTLRLVVVGRLASGPCWHLAARQHPWIGERHAAADAGLTLG